MSHQKDKGFGTYEDTKLKLRETCGLIVDTMIDQTNEKIQSKETISKATSNIRANMRTNSRIMSNY